MECVDSGFVFFGAKAEKSGKINVWEYERGKIANAWIDVCLISTTNEHKKNCYPVNSRQMLTTKDIGAFVDRR